MNINNYFFKESSSSEFPKKYNRGKSFSFSAWSPSITFTNDIFKQDFVTYKGDLWACINTNTNSIPGVSDDWYLVIKKLPAETFLPTIDEFGNISWSLYTGNSIPSVQNIRGPVGEKGDKGDPGPIGPKGERGEKGESGNGNMSVGKTTPSFNGQYNDIYLDINSGVFYKFEERWNAIGNISIGDNANLEWEDE